MPFVQCTFLRGGCVRIKAGVYMTTCWWWDGGGGVNEKKVKEIEDTDTRCISK
jgi:hypothetical protein